MTADGAYDGQVVYDVVAERHPEAAVIIPPRITAVPGETTVTQRDEHLAMIAGHGRVSWQQRSGFNRRSLAETTMFRYKTVIGRRLHARTLPNQRTEAKDRCIVLNRMTGLGWLSADVQIKKGEQTTAGLFAHQRALEGRWHNRSTARQPRLSRPPFYFTRHRFSVKRERIGSMYPNMPSLMREKTFHLIETLLFPEDNANPERGHPSDQGRLRHTALCNL